MARGQNLLNKIYNKPLLISLDDLQPIADYLSSPERVANLKFEKDYSEPPKLEDFDLESKYRKATLEYLDINPVSMTGVLNVDGVLVNREGQMNSQCVELTSYQSLKKRFEMQVEQGMKSCILMVSSGGGEAFGAWSTASYVKKLANQNGVRLTSYVNGSACSAAYVWASVADEIISHPMGQVGSIGVLVQLYNDSKMLENLGVQRSFVYAGGNKIPFGKDGSFTDKFISDLQSSVDKTYSKFVNHVVTNRDLTEQQVIDTQASVFDPEDALTLGLIDRVMELEDFELEYGLKVKGNKYNSNSSYELSGNNQSTREGNMPDKKVVENDEMLSDTHKTITTEAQADLTATMTAQLEKMELDNKALSNQLAEMSAKLEAKDSEYAELMATMQEAELSQRLASRKMALEDALGKDSDKVESLLSTTESLSDEQFEIIATSLATSQDKMNQQLAELGGEGQESNLQLSIADQIKKTAETMNRKAH